MDDAFKGGHGNDSHRTCRRPGAFPDLMSTSNKHHGGDDKEGNGKWTSKCFRKLMYSTGNKSKLSFGVDTFLFNFESCLLCGPIRKYFLFTSVNTYMLQRPPTCTAGKNKIWLFFFNFCWLVKEKTRDKSIWIMGKWSHLQDQEDVLESTAVTVSPNFSIVISQLHTRLFFSLCVYMCSTCEYMGVGG